MPATTAWDLFCSAWFSVISHWLTANSFFSRRFCSLSGWQCLSVLLCSASFIFFGAPLIGHQHLFGLLCCQYCAIAVIAVLAMRRDTLERQPFAPIARTNL